VLHPLACARERWRGELSARAAGASAWQRAGAPCSIEASAWLGHDDLNTTAIYLRTKRVSLMHAADRLEKFRAAQAKSTTKAKRPPSTPRPSGRTSVTIN